MAKRKARKIAEKAAKEFMKGFKVLDVPHAVQDGEIEVIPMIPKNLPADGAKDQFKAVLVKDGKVIGAQG